jgi:uncharacterized low-complexity protein
MTIRKWIAVIFALFAVAAYAGVASADHHEMSESADNPCADNPCADNPCGDNPCGDNPCGDNPCGDNPCGGGDEKPM